MSDERSVRGGLGSVARAGIIVSGAYLASRLLGYLRVVIIGTTFGAGPELDAFFAAFRIPDLVFQLVAAGALGSALIPALTSLLAEGERERAWRVASTVTNVMLLGLAVLAIGFEVAAPAIVPVITPGFDAAGIERTVELTRIMLVSPILLALGTVATSALNAEGRFGAAAVAPVVYNLGIIGGALLLSGPLGVQGLAVGVVVGAAGHLVVQLQPLARLGFRYHPQIDIGDPRARQTLLLMIPRAVGLGVTQLVFVVVTSVASTLGAGAVTILTFAFTLMQIPVGVIGVPLGSVVLPSLSREHALGNDAGYVSLLGRAGRLMLFVMVPAAALGIVLSRDLVTILFQYGRYDAASSGLLAGTLGFFLLGLPAHAIIIVLAQAFYARQDTATPVAAAILTVVVNSTLAVVLGAAAGLAGLAMSFTIAAWLEAIVLAVALRRRVPGFALPGLARLLALAAAAATFASLAAIVVVSLLDSTVAPGAGKVAAIARIAGGGLAFTAAYVALVALLRIPELPDLASTLARVAGIRRS